MIRRQIKAYLCAFSFAFAMSSGGTAFAGEEAFSLGPLLEDFGPNAAVEGMTPIPEGAEFRVAFDVVDAASDDRPNRSLITAARFLNMHARAGVPADKMAAAIVVHGGAVLDVSKGEPGDRHAELIQVLLENNVRIIVCGQSAAAQDVSAEDLLPGVEMSLSAMTAHALLQQDGYTLNPF